MNKQKIGFITVGTLLAIMTLISYMIKPNVVLLTFPLFVVLLWIANIFILKPKNIHQHSHFISILLVSLLVWMDFFFSPNHPWIMYCIFPVISFPLYNGLRKRFNKNHTWLIISIISVVYYVLLNYALSPMYPWSLYLIFMIGFGWLSSLFAHKNKLLAVSATMITVVILSFVTMYWIPSIDAFETIKEEESFTHSIVVSKDGTKIGYQSMGNGPDLIIIPGALTTAEEYKQFAKEFTDAFTVHLMDRRGRGLSGPQGDQYSIKKEVEDVQAIQKDTGATYVIGHSYGGFIALESAKHIPMISKLALYEPGVSINGSVPMDWTSEYQEKMKEQDYRGAFATFVKGMGAAEEVKKVPTWLLNISMHFFMRGDDWKLKEKLMSSNLKEHLEIGRHENTYKNYKDIQADTLLLGGGKSNQNTHNTLKTLSQTISKSKIITLPNLDHLAIENGSAPNQVAKPIKQFLLK